MDVTVLRVRFVPCVCVYNSGLALDRVGDRTGQVGGPRGRPAHIPETATDQGGVEGELSRERSPDGTRLNSAETGAMRIFYSLHLFSLFHFINKQFKHEHDVATQSTGSAGV